MKGRDPQTPLAVLLKESRRTRRLSLREASARVGRAGGHISHSTLLRIEQGRLEPGAAELLRIATAYGLTREEVMDAVEAQVASVAPATGTIEEIVERGTKHWRRGEIPEALGCALALRDMTPFGDEQRRLLQRSLLEFATFARGLGWTRLARRLLQPVLDAPESSKLAARALVLAAHLEIVSGSRLVARAMVEHAIRITPKNDPATRGMATHQFAKLLKVEGDFERAGATLDDAVALYRRAGEPANAARAGILRVAILEGLGRAEDAIKAARAATRAAARRGYRQVEVHARIELGRVLAATGRIEEAVAELRTALGNAVLLGDPRAEFHAQYWLWKVYGASGDAGAAKVALQAAQHLSESIDDGSEEVAEVRGT